MPNISLVDKRIAGKSNTAVDFIELIDKIGDFKKLTGINVYVKSYRNMLMTPLGTYIFDPTYGSLLYKKIFEICDDITKEDIIYEVKERIKLYDPRVIIENINVNFFSDVKGFYVSATLKRDDQTGKIDVVFTDNNLTMPLQDI
jgi:phage baseplate assembly protein W